jgi:hypothetical protein
MKMGEIPGPSSGFSIPAAMKFFELLHTSDEMSLFAAL